MLKKIYVGDISPENVMKLTRKAGEEICKIIKNEKCTEIRCSIEILPGQPMNYEIDFETLEDIRTL